MKKSLAFSGITHPRLIAASLITFRKMFDSSNNDEHLKPLIAFSLQVEENSEERVLLFCIVSLPTKRIKIFTPKLSNSLHKITNSSSEALSRLPSVRITNVGYL